jgi:putative transposase
MGYNTPCLPGMHLYQARNRIVRRASDDGLSGIRDFLKGKIDMGELGKKSEAGMNSRKRIFGRANVFILFLTQVLAGITCGQVVKFMQGARSIRGDGRISSSTSAFCQGRKRLELPFLKKISGRLSSLLTSAASGGWRGFRVMVVDGTGLDMPDTPRNRKAYPPRREKVAGTGFPCLNMAAVFELFSGGVVDWESGSKHCGEQVLWKSLMGRISMAGAVILGDCYYCSFGNIATILKKGGHCIFPLERYLVSMDKIRRLGKGESLVRLRKPSARAGSWTNRQWGMFPDFMILRLIERTIIIPGFRPKRIRLLTTLIDQEAYPADELAGLQKRRWDAELRLRDIKTAMGMEHLSCKTPAMVKKEVTMFMIAYNLVRAMMADAARSSGVAAARLSFSSSAAQTEEWMRMMLLRRPLVGKPELMKSFMSSLAECVVPFKPGRHEPRVVKQTDQRFPKMKVPRKTYHMQRKAA